MVLKQYGLKQEVFSQKLGLFYGLVLHILHLCWEDSDEGRAQVPNAKVHTAKKHSVPKEITKITNYFLYNLVGMGMKLVCKG